MKHKEMVWPQQLRNEERLQETSQRQAGQAICAMPSSLNPTLKDYMQVAMAATRRTE